MPTRLSDKRRGDVPRFQPINLIPIMNLFIVIIPMLLMITVTVHMTILSLNLMASSGGGPGDGEGGGGSDEFRIELILYPDRFELVEGSSAPTVIPLKEVRGVKQHDFTSLYNLILETKERHPDVGVIRIMPHDDLFYGTLVKAIDICKFNGFPEVIYRRFVTIAV